MTEIQTSIETLQNMLVAIATGGSPDETEYKKLRNDLLNHVELEDKIPTFIKTNRTGGQFWQFIKYKFSTYADRRKYIWEEFSPLLDHVENKNSGVTIKQGQEKTKMKKIFISHSSQDAGTIKMLVDLIEVIGVSSNRIFFSSHPAYGVSPGENIFERLKKELSDEILALFILTDNFYKSPVCLCEMGAVWIKTNKQIPILIPPFEFNSVKGVFPNSLGFKINDKAQLNNFKIELDAYFNLEQIHPTRWEEKRDEFINKFESGHLLDGISISKLR